MSTAAANAENVANVPNTEPTAAKDLKDPKDATTADDTKTKETNPTPTPAAEEKAAAEEGKEDSAETAVVSNEPALDSVTAELYNDLDSVSVSDAKEKEDTESVVSAANSSASTLNPDAAPFVEFKASTRFVAKATEMIKNGATDEEVAELHDSFSEQAKVLSKEASDLSTQQTKEYNIIKKALKRVQDLSAMKTVKLTEKAGAEAGMTYIEGSLDAKQTAAAEAEKRADAYAAKEKEDAAKVQHALRILMGI